MPEIIQKQLDDLKFEVSEITRKYNILIMMVSEKFTDAMLKELRKKFDDMIRKE
jgi:hypothetical protein